MGVDVWKTYERNYDELFKLICHEVHNMRTCELVIHRFRHQPRLEFSTHKPIAVIGSTVSVGESSNFLPPPPPNNR